MHGGDPRLVFINVQYEIETSEAERIAVEHVAKSSDSSADSGLGNACELSCVIGPADD